MAMLLVISCLMLALDACQSSRSLSDRMESKYSLKKRKTSISRLRPQGPERCDLPVPVSIRDYRTMLDSIEKSLGIRYRFGGNAPDGFDCSGFIQYLFSSSFHLLLPRTSTDLALLGPLIPRNRLEKGDLVFFSSGKEIDHVGVYLGSGRFAHASTTAGVIISPLAQLHYETRFAFGTRIIRIKQ
jgi:murein DD-endopeptidase / murein LD-carboxypeptidase